MEYVPFAIVAVEYPLEGPPDTWTSANCNGTPVSQAVMVPAKVPC